MHNHINYIYTADAVVSQKQLWLVISNYKKHTEVGEMQI